jgi:MFS family permease
MLNILSNRTYRHLFMAQVIALIGTGLATVALGLLAYDLAGDRAGAVLGTALAIKMSAYILVAPVAAAFADKFPRRTMLVTLDLVRALVAIALPFVTQIWEIYILIFVLQSASAAFTPTFRRQSRIFFLTNANIPGRCLCRVWPTIWKALSARCWRRRC